MSFETVVPLAVRALLDEHRRILVDESGIDPEVIEGRGYYSLTQREILQLVQLEVVSPVATKATGALAIPIFRPDGEKHGEVLRLFGVELKSKYLWPLGLRNAVDIHPFSLAHLHDPAAIVILTEGSKKADALLSAARREGIPAVVLSINGNYGWRATINGDKMAVPDFFDIPLSNRKVYIVPDSDFRSNDLVSRGWTECADYLTGKTGPNRTFLSVIPPQGRNKQGADDYLSAGGTLESLLGLAQSPRHSLLDRDDTPTPLVVKSAFQLISESSQGIPHLINPLIPENSVVLVTGHSGTLKTWHMLDLALSGACGLRWLEHPDLTMRDEPINLLYVNKEMNGIVLGQRLRTLARHERYAKVKDIEEILRERIITTDEAIFDMRDPQQRDRLEEAIVLYGINIVVLDSLSMCWTGEENSNSEVGQFYKELRLITERTHVTWILVHHLGKPQGNGRSRNPVMFSIRGAGQLVQQADAAIILSKLESPNMSPDMKEIAIVQAKARTATEMIPFVTRFEDHDGISTSIRYLTPLSTSQEKAYEASGGDPQHLDGWIMRALIARPEMQAETGPGLRDKGLAEVLAAGWEGSDRARPSPIKIKQRFDYLVEIGDLEIMDENSRQGKLYRLTKAYSLRPEEDGDDG